MIPNIRIRADQEEMFEMNWVEYVRRDTEGSDSDTRRRAATELVRALTDKFPQEARMGGQATVVFEGTNFTEQCHRARLRAHRHVYAGGARGEQGR